MGFVPFSYWGYGSTDLLPSSSLVFYYNANDPASYDPTFTASVSNSATGIINLANQANNLGIVVGGKGYDNTYYGINTVSGGFIDNEIPLVIYESGQQGTILVKGYISPFLNIQNKYLLRNTRNSNDGIRGFGTVNVTTKGKFTFSRGVVDADAVPTASMYNTEGYGTIAITKQLGESFGRMSTSANNFSVEYAGGSTNNEFNLIFEQLGYFQAIAYWDRKLSTSELIAASNAFNTNGRPEGFNATTSSTTGRRVRFDGGTSGTTAYYLEPNQTSLTRTSLAIGQTIDACVCNSGSRLLTGGSNVSAIDLGIICTPTYNIQNCISSSVTASISLSGSLSLGVGSVFKTISGSFLSGSCWTVTEKFDNQFTSPATYTNIIPSSTFTNCDLCLGTKALFDYLIVAGGGGGGTTTGGGGGAGGYLASSILASTGSYSVIVGNGGAIATNGQTSSMFNLTAIGGGFGGYGTTATPYGTGSVGGSGGGGTGGGPNTIISGSLGTAGQGNAGGLGRQTTGNNQSAGGGGGAATAGRPYFDGRFGGSGSQWLDGNYYAGGGGGSYSGNGTVTNINGGIGGGGKGATFGVGNSATNGSPNTGGGGGGGLDATYIAGSGGSGIVKLRYESGSVMNATGGTILVSGSYVYHTFTGSGTFTF